MRLESGPATSSSGNWIILVAMIAAFGAVVGAIFELNREGEKYAEPFVRQDALRIVIETELAGVVDAWLHEYAAEQELSLERVYRTGEGLDACLQSGQADGQVLDAYLLASERLLEGWSERLTFTPQAGSTIWYARQENSGRTATLERLEAALTAAAGWAEKPSEQD